MSVLVCGQMKFTFNPEDGSITVTLDASVDNELATGKLDISEAFDLKYWLERQLPP